LSATAQCSANDLAGVTSCRCVLLVDCTDLVKHMYCRC